LQRLEERIIPFIMNARRRDDLIIFLATGGFSGFLPKIPGTWGTFAAIPLVLLVHLGDGLTQAVTAVVFVMAAVWIAARAEVLLNSKDAGPIVIDEMVGFVFTLLWLPIGFPTVCLGFVLFRFFDIVKPPPTNILERRLPGGWGVVMDDVMAGIYANISLRILLPLLTRIFHQ
jgi:phosphatidylglycerophosphatase A